MGEIRLDEANHLQGGDINGKLKRWDGIHSIFTLLWKEKEKVSPSGHYRLFTSLVESATSPGISGSPLTESEVADHKSGVRNAHLKNKAASRKTVIVTTDVFDALMDEMTLLQRMTRPWETNCHDLEGFTQNRSSEDFRTFTVTIVKRSIQERLPILEPSSGVWIRKWL